MSTDRIALTRLSSSMTSPRPTFIKMDFCNVKNKEEVH